MVSDSTLLVPQDRSGDRALRASIIIVSFNSRQKVIQCLDSLGRTISADCEIIVVDNASVDGSAEAVETSFPDVILIRSNTNCGFGAGSNLGARRAAGGYLIFLNPDTLVESGWIEALLAPFEMDARAGLVTAKVLLADQPDRINACG